MGQPNDSNTTETTAPSATGDEPAADPATDQGAPVTSVPKKARFIRIWGLVVVVLLAIAAWTGVLFGLEPWLADRLRQALAERNLHLSDDTAVAVSTWHARLALDQVAISEQRDDQQRQVLTADEAVCDLGLWATVSQRDVVIDRLVLRNSVYHGRLFDADQAPVPVEAPKDIPIDEQVEKPTDWIALGQQFKLWHQRWRDLMGDDEADEATPEEEAERRPRDPDPAWDDAVRYHPYPGDYHRRVPRVLIRDLAISGSAAAEAASPVAMDAFQLAGRMVTPILDPDEETTLEGSFTTRAAGTIALGSFRRTHDEGELHWEWTGLPLEVLASEHVFGDNLAVYGLRGDGRMTCDATWKSGDLTGTLVVAMTDPVMEPTAAAGTSGREAARVLNEIRRLHQEIAAGEPLVVTWDMELGGAPWAPLVRGLSVHGLIYSLQNELRALTRRAADRAVGETRERGERAVREVIEGENPEDVLDKNKKDLEESAGGLLDRFGR